MTEGDNRPLSQIYLEEGLKSAELTAAADLLEGTLTLRRAQRQLALGDIPVSRSEMIVKAQQQSFDDVAECVEARKEANKQKVRVKSIEMEYGEWNSHQADERTAARL